MRVLILASLLAFSGCTLLISSGCASLSTALDDTKPKADRIAAALEAAAQALCAADLATRDAAADKLQAATFLTSLATTCLESDTPVVVKP
jgi:hypothetical protein